MVTEKIGKRRWGIASLLAVGILINYFDRINLSVAAPHLSEAFHLGPAQVGLLFSAFFWPYALLQLPAGLILDRFGVKRVGRWGAFLWGVASMLTAAASGFGGIFAARMMLGVAEAPGMPTCSKAVGYWFPLKERSRAAATFDAAGKLSNVIGVPMVAFAVVQLGWRWGFIVTAVLSFFYFIFFTAFYRDPDSDRKLGKLERDYIRSGGASREGALPVPPSVMVRHVLSSRKIWGLLLGSAAVSYCFYLFLTWLPNYLFHQMHIGLVGSASFATIPWLAAATAELAIGGWLVDHLITRGFNESRVRKSVFATGLLCGMTVIGATQTHSTGWAIFWISTALAGVGMATPTTWALSSLLAPKGGVGTVAASMNFANSIMGVLAPIVTGVVIGATGSFSAAFVVAGVILVIGALSVVVLIGEVEPLADPQLQRDSDLSSAASR